jgi:hypothetical protein
LKHSFNRLTRKNAMPFLRMFMLLITNPDKQSIILSTRRMKSNSTIINNLLLNIIAFLLSQ